MNERKILEMSKKGDKKWYKSPINWIITIACIILIPMLLMNLWIMIQSKLNTDKVPSVFGYKPFMVLSRSMENTILEGDLIITKVVNPETLVVGDIVAYRDSEGTVTTHRIIDIANYGETKYLITKGDNNNIQDRNLVEFKDVEGKYLYRIPGIGSMMKNLSEPTTILLLVFGITIIFGIGFVISTKKQQELERLEFLEYKRQKELEESSSKTKKTKSIKAVEDDELLEEEEEEEPQPKKKKNSTNSTKTSKTKSKK